MGVHRLPVEYTEMLLENCPEDTIKELLTTNLNHEGDIYGCILWNLIHAQWYKNENSESYKALLDYIDKRWLIQSNHRGDYYLDDKGGKKKW